MRYRRVRRFFVGVLVHALWWDLILNRPLLRRLRTSPLGRWQRIARRYRELAVELGGVLIKLGQFLSTRVDLLPLEIIRELRALQDEVPPAPVEEIVARIEADFERPLGEVFSWFSTHSVGAASLAQVHSARLLTGEEVVVKVLRPRIHILVETDLAAFAHATRWLRHSSRIRRRVDVEWLEREFRQVTRSELDLEAEGRNAERFASDFADDPKVLVPKIFWSHTASHTLTMENVAYLKVGDLAALDAAGIDRKLLATHLYSVYMRQFFVTHFVHADPHPGNIFVRPLLSPNGSQLAGTASPGAAEVPFQIAFVDFGMMTEIPARLRKGLREFAIGLGTRDARKVVSSYVTAGTLLPGADVERLIEAHEALFARFWGVRLAEMRNVAISEANTLALQFRDLVFQAPIQLQADMLFAMRAVGLLAGLSTTLDPAFDPWQETAPFAERFAREDQAGRWRDLVDQIGTLAHSMLMVPRQLDHLLSKAEAGTLGVRASLSKDARQRITRLERAVNRLTWTLAGSALLISGVVVHAAGVSPGLTPWLLGTAAAAFLAGLMPRTSEPPD